MRANTRKMNSDCIAFLLIVLLFIWDPSSHRASAQTADGSEKKGKTKDIYSNVLEANLTESYLRIREVPIKKYQFLYDSVPDRVQMGVLPADAQRWFPDAVDIISSYPVPNKDRSKPSVVLKNFATVDKNVVFMHGVAALKELLKRYEELCQRMYGLTTIEDRYKDRISQLESLLDAEVSKQALLDAAKAELEREIAEKQFELLQVREKEEGLLIEKRLEEEKKVMELQEALSTERTRLQQELEEKRLIRELELERELSEKKEDMKRQSEREVREAKETAEREINQHRVLLEKEKITAEIAAKAEQERLSEEINLRKLRTQAELDTKRLVSGIQTVVGHFTKGVTSLLDRPWQIAAFAGACLLFVLAYYSIKELARLIRVSVQNYFGRPSLVRETSFSYAFLPRSISSSFPWNWLFDWDTKAPEASLADIEKVFGDVILSPQDRQSVVQLALTTKNSKKLSVPFRHLLLYGPPGTGKTMIARKLASCSGLDYAIMSGGDVGPLGEDAVNQLHGLFRWANRSHKGLLIFIDEAEAFLASRDGTGAIVDESQTHLRYALNALLYQTGTPSKTFMLVLATNRPQDIDSAILDRMDVSMLIGIPEAQERVELLSLYSRVHITSVVDKYNKDKGKGTCSVSKDCFSVQTLSEAAALLKGFSGREVSKLMVAVRYAMEMAAGRCLTKDIFFNMIRAKVKEHRDKSAFSQEGEGVRTRASTTVSESVSSSNASSMVTEREMIDRELAAQDSIVSMNRESYDCTDSNELGSGSGSGEDMYTLPDTNTNSSSRKSLRKSLHPVKSKVK